MPAIIMKKPAMFFLNKRAKKVTFEDCLSEARAAGFTVQPADGGRSRIERAGVASIVEKGDEEKPRFAVSPGVIMAGEIGALTDQGFQKVFVTPSGKRKAALAADLRNIHAYQEDLREAFGLTSLYNESMGTVSRQYVYDRVVGRDSGHANKPWQAHVQR